MPFESGEAFLGLPKCMIDLFFNKDFFAAYPKVPSIDSTFYGNSSWVTSLAVRQTSPDFLPLNSMLIH